MSTQEKTAKQKHACMLLALLLFFAAACEGQSSRRLTASSSLSGNQTLVSDGGGDFAMGLFTPSNSSTNRYLGIWDNSIPGRSVVWVANRESPLKDAVKGAVTISADGNLVVLDANGTAVWSSGLSPSNATTFAVLKDSGNLELTRASAAATGRVDTVVWRSFDHPGDTWLPGINLWLDIKTGESNRLVSSRSEQDPSPGDFSFGIDPKSMLQYKVWRRQKETFIRSDVWDGLSISVGRQNATSAVVVQQLDFTGGNLLNFSFSLTKGSPAARVQLTPSGVPYNLFWQPSTSEWIRVPALSGSGCSFYNRCGSNAVCEDNDTVAATQVSCQCLPGFVPADPQGWDTGNHSRGCTRRVLLSCNRNEEGFRRMQIMKLPDNFRVFVNASEEQCLDECRHNCSCTAYSYSNVNVLVSTSRCLIWTGNLVDLTNYTSKPDDLSGEIFLRLPSSELATEQRNGSSRKISIVLAVVLPVIGMLLLGALVCILTRRRRGRRKPLLLDEFNMPSILGNEEHPTMLKVLDFSTLQAATNHFSTENRLGQGGFGPVYKGKLHGGQEVAIKRLSKCSGQGFQEFRNEVEVIARLQHTNLVRLLGLCIHDKEKILIYEYMPNTSLDKFIFDPTRKEELTWPRRFNIIQGIAQGLLYLHRYSRLRIIHRDMKASNILLDDEMNPKISDFGLARIIGKNETEGNTNRVVGTFGYMSPEYAFDGLFSEKSDVFAFGVIMLEVVTGKRSTGCYLYKESLNLLGYVWEHWKEGKALDLVDSSLGADFSIDDAAKCIQIGLLCIQEKAVDRPSMSSVISMLDSESAALPSPNQPPFSAQKCADGDNSQCHSSTWYSLSTSMTCQIIRARQTQ